MSNAIVELGDEKVGSVAFNVIDRDGRLEIADLSISVEEPFYNRFKPMASAILEILARIEVLRQDK